jgi:hypothetical protein
MTVQSHDKYTIYALHSIPPTPLFRRHEKEPAKRKFIEVRVIVCVAELGQGVVIK